MTKMAKLKGECDKSLEESKTNSNKLKKKVEKLKAQSNEEVKKKTEKLEGEIQAMPMTFHNVNSDNIALVHIIMYF